LDCFDGLRLKNVLFLKVSDLILIRANLNGLVYFLKKNINKNNLHQTIFTSRSKTNYPKVNFQQDTLD